MASSTRVDTFELSDYLGVVRRRWKIIVVLVIIGIAAGAAYAKVAPTTYAASVLVQDNSLPNNANSTGGRTGGAVNMDNEAQVAQSLVVATAVTRALHSPLSPKALVKQIAVSVPPNTTFIQISCNAPSASAAATCANAFGAAYLAERRNNIASGLSNELTAATARISALITTIADLKAQFSALPTNSPTRVTVQLKLNQAQAGLSTQDQVANTLQPELDNLNVPKNTVVGSIATPATPPLAPSSPSALLLVPSGALAGLLIGLLWAAFTDRKDKRIHSARDVERFLDTPVLVDVTFTKSNQHPGIISSRSRAGQAFSELAQYVAASLGEGSHVLLVAGTSAGPGCSLAAANLAVTLARTRSEVILVCADAHSTISPQLLGVPAGRGLSDVLSRACSPADVMRRPADLSRLRVIAPGTSGADGGFQLQFESARWLFSELKDARYVIVELQSIGADSDAFALAEFADSAILVVEESVTSRAAAAACLHRLDRLRTEVLGAVVLQVPRGRKPAGRPAPAAAEDSAPATATLAAPHKPEAASLGRAVPSRSPVPSTTGRQPRGSSGAADRDNDKTKTPPDGLGETRPLPRFSRDRPADRPAYNPTDKIAGH